MIGNCYKNIFNTTSQIKFFPRYVFWDFGNSTINTKRINLLPEKQFLAMIYICKTETHMRVARGTKQFL